MQYWDQQEASYDGVLGGFGYVSDYDISDSRSLLQRVSEFSVCCAAKLLVVSRSALARLGVLGQQRRSEERPGVQPCVSAILQLLCDCCAAGDEAALTTSSSWATGADSSRWVQRSGCGPH